MELISPRRQILRSIGLIVLIILLIFLLVDFEALWEVIRLTDWREYFLSVGFLIVMYALYTLRTRFLLQQKLSYFDALSVDSTGFMFGILMQLPKDAFRIVAWNRSDGINASLTASAVTIGGVTSWLVRSLGLIFAIVLVAADSGDAERPLFVSIVVVVGMLVLLMALAKNSERIQPSLTKGLSHFPRVTLSRAEKISANIAQTLGHIASIRRFGMALFLTLLVWIFSLLFYFYSFESMNVELATPHLFVALAAMIIAPPNSPMMIGVFHGAIIAILGTLGLMDADSAAAYAINIHFVQMVLLIILGVLGMRRLNLGFLAIVKEIRASTHKQAEA